MNLLKELCFAVILLIGMSSSTIYALNVDDYCSLSKNAPKGVKTPTPLNDGMTYAAISDDGRSIDVYNYRTGKKTSTLFSLDSQKGDVKIEEFDGYEISENERKILLWNEVKKIYRHSFTAEYYVYDTMRGTLQRVSTQGPQRGATMSHDGRCVAYTRGNNIFISNLDYGTDKAITKDGVGNKIINGVPDWAYEEEFGMLTAMRWSKDDLTLAYLKFDESNVPVYEFDQYKSYCEGNPLSDLYPDSYRYKYPLAGYPNSVVRLLAYNLDNQTTKEMDLKIGERYVPDFRFDGQGKNLMVMILNRDQNLLELYKVNPASTIGHLVLTERSNAWLSPEAYQMVDYHVDSFVIGSERSGYRHLYEYDYNGNLLRTVTAGDWNVTHYYGYDARSKKYYIQTTQLGAINRNVAAVDSKGIVTMLNSEAGTENAWFSRNCDFYLRSYSTAVQPPVYSICNNKGAKLVDVEDNSEYKAKYSEAPIKEFIQIPNSQGEMMSGYIIKPKDFDSSKRYPLLMYQYNGPDSQEVLNRWKMEGVYYLASQGYIVGCVDGRGTGNRSRQWAECVYQNLGKYETEDQILGAQWFGQQNYIDNNRIGCFGWSYGGYMTLMEMSSGISPFKAGVAMAPVTDWRFYDSIYTERYMRTPQQNNIGYNNASALDRTPQLQGRLLIMSGTSDDNVHFYNTLKYTSKLFNEGVEFDMMALTGFEHSLPMCDARVNLFKKIKDFLDKNL